MQFINILPCVRYARIHELMVQEFREKLISGYDHRIFICISGNGSIEVNGKNYTMKCGNLLFWKGGDSYCFHDQDMTLIGVNFDFFLHESISNIPIPPDLSHNFKHNKIIESINFTDATIFNSTLFLTNVDYLIPDFYNILEEYSQKKVFYEKNCSAILTKILTNCLRTAWIGGTKKTNLLADQIIKYIQEHLKERITYETISENFHYHPNHINRIIKKRTGESFHQYILSQRMELAIDLLQTTGISIYDLSEQLHFKDIKSFSHCFKNYTGFSPSHYRSK